jgi:hypothetical protein
MPQLPSINRTSLTTNLQARYESSSRLGGDIGTAKFVGTDRAVTDMINGTARGITGNDVHSAEFGRGGFTSAGKNYAKDVLKHNNTQYYG